MINDIENISSFIEFKPDAVIHNRYRVIKLLGRGGMGAAYLVNDLSTPGTEIVLKVLQPSAMEGNEQDSLRHEFRVLARLRHPNLVRVYDYGRLDEGTGHFFTMEYVSGKSLSEVVKNLSTDEVTELAAQILRALEYVHSSGLIHGDIKDDNILVTQNKDGQHIVKLMDFGLAVHTKAGGDVNVSGTIEYLAPERLRGAPPNPAVDLYAFGVLMYQCLSGKFPFMGTPEEITKGHLHIAFRPD